MKIIVTSIGRRVQLIQHLRKTFKIVGVDSSINNAARFFVDDFFQIPPCDSIDYVDELIRIAVLNDVKMIIPLYENEFDVLCKNRQKFEEKRIKLLLSEQKVIEICNDKFSTQAFFERENINAPKIVEVPPAVLKPRKGMGSQGVFCVNKKEELLAAKTLSNDYIIQELIEGIEYTIDVLCDFQGEVIYCVPRERSEVRAGEVSKSKIKMNELIIKETIELVKKLNTYGMVIGPITIQCFLCNKEEIVFLEINPRFGGGVPLSMEAGADYGSAIEKFLKNEKVEVNKIKEMTMFRYDMAVYIE